ncbi:Transcription initiation factor TFIID subunit 10 [Conglomerata obtusa]
MDNETFNKVKENLDDYVPLIPEVVIDHFAEKAGVQHLDKDVKKVISLIAQKFVTDVSVSSFQWHKIHQKGVQKDKRFAKEKKITFNMNDLQMALEEKGIDIGRPHYFM